MPASKIDPLTKTISLVNGAKNSNSLTVDVPKNLRKSTTSASAMNTVSVKVHKNYPPDPSSSRLHSTHLQCVNLGNIILINQTAETPVASKRSEVKVPKKLSWHQVRSKAPPL